MGLPTMMGMIITALYNVADAYFVSGLGNSEFAAVTIVFPIVQIMVGVGLFFGVGSASYISRLLGANDAKKAGATASLALSHGLIIIVLIIIILFLFLEEVLLALGSTPAILPYSKSYAKIIILGSFLTVANITMCNIITAEGKANTTMFIMFSGALLNIILDPLFIYSLGLGVNGAAYATVISQVISTSLGLLVLLHNRTIIELTLADMKFNREILGEIFKIGFPVLLYQIFTSTSMSLTNIAAKPRGEEAIAAMGIMLRVMAIGLFIVFGFSKGFMPIVGMNFGAGNHQRVREAIKITNRWGFIFCSIFALVIVMGSKTIAETFSPNGSGKAREGGILNIARQGLFFIPLVTVLPYFWGIEGLLFTQPLSDVLTILLTAYFVHKNRELLKGSKKIKTKDTQKT